MVTARRSESGASPTAAPGFTAFDRVLEQGKAQWLCAVASAAPTRRRIHPVRSRLTDSSVAYFELGRQRWADHEGARRRESSPAAATRWSPLSTTTSRCPGRQRHCRDRAGAARRLKEPRARSSVRSASSSSGVPAVGARSSFITTTGSRRMSPTSAPTTPDRIYDYSPWRLVSFRGWHGLQPHLRARRADPAMVRPIPMVAVMPAPYFPVAQRSSPPGRSKWAVATGNLS